MAFCGECGTPRVASGLFCGSCGWQFPAAPATTDDNLDDLSRSLTAQLQQEDVPYRPPARPRALTTVGPGAAAAHAPPARWSRELLDALDSGAVAFDELAAAAPPYRPPAAAAAVAPPLRPRALTTVGPGAAAQARAHAAVVARPQSPPARWSRELLDALDTSTVALDEPPPPPPQPRCAGCRQALPSEVPAVRALGKAWCAACFRCARCRQRLVHTRFFEVDGEVLCAADADRHRPQCVACETAIVEGTLLRDGRDRTYHAACFKCGVCGASLRGRCYFWTASGREQICCQRCSAEAGLDPRCEVCQAVIPAGGAGAVRRAPRRADAPPTFYHPGCFVCARCQAPIRALYFLSASGSLLCEACVASGGAGGGGAPTP